MNINPTSNRAEYQPTTYEYVRGVALQISFENLNMMGISSDNLEKLTLKAKVLTLTELDEIIEKNQKTSLDKNDINSIKEAFNFPESPDDEVIKTAEMSKEILRKNIKIVFRDAANSASKWYFKTLDS